MSTGWGWLLRTYARAVWRSIVALSCKSLLLTLKRMPVLQSLKEQEEYSCNVASCCSCSLRYPSLLSVQLPPFSGFRRGLRGFLGIVGFDIGLLILEAKMVKGQSDLNISGSVALTLFPSISDYPTSLADGNVFSTIIVAPERLNSKTTATIVRATTTTNMITPIKIFFLVCLNFSSSTFWFSASTSGSGLPGAYFVGLAGIAVSASFQYLLIYQRGSSGLERFGLM